MLLFSFFFCQVGFFFFLGILGDIYRNPGFWNACMRTQREGDAPYPTQRNAGLKGEQEQSKSKRGCSTVDVTPGQAIQERILASFG